MFAVVVSLDLLCSFDLRLEIQLIRHLYFLDFPSRIFHVHALPLSIIGGESSTSSFFSLRPCTFLRIMTRTKNELLHCATLY